MPFTCDTATASAESPRSGSPTANGSRARRSATSPSTGGESMSCRGSGGRAAGGELAEQLAERAPVGIGDDRHDDRILRGGAVEVDGEAEQVQVQRPERQVEDRA